MEKEINFKPKSKLLKWYLFMNKGMVIFFSIFYLIMACALLSFSTMNGFGRAPWIAPTYISVETVSLTSGSTMWSIYEVVSMAVFNAPGISLFFIANIYFISKMIVKEINQGQISIWITFNVSRLEVIISKMLAIFIFNLIIFMPTFMVLFIFSAVSYDAKTYLGLFIVYALQFFIFIILLFSALLLVSVFFEKSQLVLNVILGVVLVWFILTWILIIINDLTQGTIKMLTYAKYFAPQSLIFPVLKFGYDTNVWVQEFPVDVNTAVVEQAALKKINLGTAILMPILMVVSIVALNYFTIKKFQNIDIKI